MNYNECIDKLNLIPQFVKGTGIDRARKILKALGNPENNLKVIHVAGTNGKGSTCVYITNVIEKIGHRVGLFTSPHLEDERERIQINNELISQDDFLKYYQRVEDAYRVLVEEDPSFEISYFDYFFAIAMLYYRDSNVDYVVCETGLGGKLDATNAIEKPILSIITTISLEHTAILGDTIEKIAAEKAGIIKKGVPVIYSRCVSGAGEVIANQALQLNTEAIGVDEKDYLMTKNSFGCIDFLIHNEYYNNDCFSISNNALYQLENVTIALTAFAKLVNMQAIKGELKDYIPLIRDAVFNTRWSGRMERITDNIIVDGAHNPQGIHSFVNSIEALYREADIKPADLLFSVVSDKNFEEMIEIICSCPIFSKIYITVTGGKRFLSKDVIRNTFAKFGDFDVESFDTVDDAIDSFTRYRGDEHYLFATGSLYLVGDIKKVLKGKIS